MTIGLHIQADSGRSEDELYSIAIATKGRTHVVLNGPGLAARLLQAGKRVIYRRWAHDIKRGNDWNPGDNMANDWYDPVDFVNRIHAVAPAGAILELGNEPWGNSVAAMLRITDWTVKALERCEQIGRKGGIFSFPTGNPPDNDLWRYAVPALQKAKDGGHPLLSHQYWGADKSIDALSSKNAPWHINRDTLIPPGLPLPEIVVTELGLAYNMDAQAGYVGRMSDDAYADQLIAVQRVYAGRGIDSCVFVLTNKGNANWDSFNVSEKVVERIAAYNTTEQASPVTPPPIEPTGYRLRPVVAPYQITSPFGPRENVEPKDHKGVDYVPSAPYHVRASKGGVVTFAGQDNTGFGNLIIIDEGGGIESLYAHLASFAVTKGQTVAEGQHIGVAGSTGNSTALHLHYELRINGVAVNPALYNVVAEPPVVTPPVPEPEPDTAPPWEVEFDTREEMQRVGQMLVNIGERILSAPGRRISITVRTE